MPRLRTSVEKLVRALHEVVLHSLHHGRKRLAERSGKEFLWQVNYVFRDALTEHECGYLVREVITVVLEHIVSGLSVLVRDVLQELHEDLFRDLSAAQGEHFGRST